MKRSPVIIAVLVFMSALIGCAGAETTPPSLTSYTSESASLPASQTANEQSAVPSPSIAESASPSPTETNTSAPSPSHTATQTTDSKQANLYTDKYIGISFTVPQSWAGKYCIDSYYGSVTVYFDPAVPIPTDGNKEYGVLFHIYEKYSEYDELYYGQCVEFDVKGVTYICGTPKYTDYSQDQPEYDTFATMQKDIPAIFASIRLLSGQMPENFISQPTPAPMALVYTSTKLGIQFSMPESWEGKYRVKEHRDSLYVYFVPEDPDAGYGDRWLFMIAKKSPETEGLNLDGAMEIDINGVTYICGDVEYEGPEDETFADMNSDVQAIFYTIRAAE